MNQCVLTPMAADEPNWAPLEATLSREECGAFMYMGRHGDIELYKHYFTRCYLNISGDFQHFYQYLDGLYVEIPKHTALTHVRG